MLDMTSRIMYLRLLLLPKILQAFCSVENGLKFYFRASLRTWRGLLILCLVQHWNRRPIININEFYQLVLGQFSSFWLPYAGIVLRPSPYSVIYFQQVIVSLSIFCCKYSLVAVVRNRFYLLTHSLTQLPHFYFWKHVT